MPIEPQQASNCGMPKIRLSVNVNFCSWKMLRAQLQVLAFFFFRFVIFFFIFFLKHELNSYHVTSISEKKERTHSDDNLIRHLDVRKFQLKSLFSKRSSGIYLLLIYFNTVFLLFGFCVSNVCGQNPARLHEIPHRAKLGPVCCEVWAQCFPFRGQKGTVSSDYHLVYVWAACLPQPGFHPLKNQLGWWKITLIILASQCFINITGSSTFL